MPLPLLAAERRCELSTAEFHTSVTPFGNSVVHPSYQQITVPAVMTTYNTWSWSWKNSNSILLSLKKSLSHCKHWHFHYSLPITPLMLCALVFPLLFSHVFFFGWVRIRTGLDSRKLSKTWFVGWLFFVSERSSQTILKCSPSQTILDGLTGSHYTS